MDISAPVGESTHTEDVSMNEPVEVDGSLHIQVDGLQPVDLPSVVSNETYNTECSASYVCIHKQIYRVFVSSMP